MSYWGVLAFLLLQLVRNIRGEVSLEIVKIVDGNEVPVSYTLREVSGRNITLTCKLSVSALADNSSYYDEELLWGWERQNVKFNKVADLLANNNLESLKQFLNNLTTISFSPLLPIDSGKYFCVSLKYKLFRAVKVHVIENVSSRNKPTTNFSGSVSVPKVNCKKDMFVCNLRRTCIKNEYVCDNVQDCDDGSDENVYLCGKNPCEDKFNCSNGRCISESLCCDNCTSSFSPLCCSEIVRKRTLEDIETVKQVEAFPSYRRLIPASDAMDPDIWKAINEPQQPITIPSFKAMDDSLINDDFQKYLMTMPSVNVDDLQDTSNIDYHSFDVPYNKPHHKRFFMIPLGLFVLILTICMIAVRCKNSNTEARSVGLLRISTLSVFVPRNNENDDSSANSDGNNDADSEDLPPSYDEAVVNVPQKAPLVS